MRQLRGFLLWLAEFAIPILIAFFLGTYVGWRRGMHDEREFQARQPRITNGDWYRLVPK